MKKVLLGAIVSILTFSCTKDSSEPIPTSDPIVKYTVQFQTSTGGTVSSSGGSYDKGSKLTITAIPENEYVFDSWSDGSTENPREIVVNSDINITALFVKKQYQLTINIEGEGVVSEEIIVQGNTSSANYNSGTTVRLTATSGEGWEFKEWQGDISSSENPYDLNISSEINVTAIFVESQPVFDGSIVLDFYDVPEDQNFEHVFFTNSPGWNQYYELEERMFKKIILYNSDDEPIGETFYKPEDNLQIELPLPTESGAHYLKEYLFFIDENAEGNFQNTPINNFDGDFYLFNFRYQYEINFTDPIYTDTEIQYEINHQNDALLLVDKNIDVLRVGVGTTGFAPGGRHIYVNSDYESYPIRLYFDSYYIDKVVSPARESTIIIEINENDVLVDYPVGSTDLWKKDPIYSSLKADFDNGEVNGLNEFLNAFKLEAEEFNVDLGSDPILSIQSNLNIDGTDYLAITEDICGETKIKVSSLFNDLTFGQQVAVLYHEFGHAYFGYDHEEFGLMLPDISISQYRNYTALKGELGRFFDQSKHSTVNCSGNIRPKAHSIEGQKLNKAFLKL